jgi:hypothetical protein
MSVQVINLLETIKIDAENREVAAAPAGIFENPRKLVIQRGAVRQIRQRIVASQMQDTLLSALAIGHVECHSNPRIAAIVA